MAIPSHSSGPSSRNPRAAWRVSVLAESRTATLADPTNPLSLTGETTTLVRNGRTYTRTFAAAGRTVTEQSPAGRQRVQTLDAKGRVLSDRLGGLAPTNVSYDAQGRLITATRGTSGSARTFSMGYDTLNRLVSVTDPLSRTLGFTYNDADRVVTETLPDARQVRYTYDADGNLTSVTPPGRPTHTSSLHGGQSGERVRPAGCGGRAHGHDLLLQSRPAADAHHTARQPDGRAWVRFRWAPQHRHDGGWR
ncbi:MAG: hypothetical protein E6J55_15700 [Deltaproteobacteria bacterium]|nr:MAG: hypothetical protein E6J55_15700 [Deltaproteobacteria bacterium]